MNCDHVLVQDFPILTFKVALGTSLNSLVNALDAQMDTLNMFSERIWAR